MYDHMLSGCVALEDWCGVLAIREKERVKDDIGRVAKFIDSKHTKEEMEGMF